MRKFIVIGALLTLVYSCGKENNTKEIEKPASLIEKDKMIKVLVDFHLAEEYINQEHKRDSKIFANRYYYSLFEKYNITAEDFKNSVDYYTQLPEEFDAMYADVITELDKLQTQLNAATSEKATDDKPEKTDNNSLDKDSTGGSNFFQKIKEKALQEAKPTKKDNE